MKTTRLFSRILAVLFMSMALSFTGCMPGDQPTNVGGTDPDPEEPVNPGEKPSGGGNTLYSFTLYADTGYNINGIRYNSDGQLISTNSEWRFCNVGAVSDIAKIKNIPWSTWAEVSGVRAGDGVVAYHPSIGYMSIYIAQDVRNETGRVVGIGVIYRPNFTGADEPVEFKSTDISVSAAGETVVLPITSKSYTPFQITVIDDDWCHAEATSVNGMFMPSRVTVTVDENTAADARETRILVGTIYGKTTYLYVRQAGAGSDSEAE